MAIVLDCPAIMQTIIRHTTRQAATRLGIDESIVRKYCREGRLGERIGRNFSITEEDLKRFIERRRIKPAFGRPPKQVPEGALA